MSWISRLFLNNFWIHFFRFLWMQATIEPTRKTFGSENKNEHKFHAEYAFFPLISAFNSRKPVIYASCLLQRWKIKHTTKASAKFTHENFFVSTYLDGETAKIGCLLPLWGEREWNECAEQSRMPRISINFSIYIWSNIRCFTFSPEQYAALIMHLLIFWGMLVVCRGTACFRGHFPSEICYRKVCIHPSCSCILHAKSSFNLLQWEFNINFQLGLVVGQRTEAGEKTFLAFCCNSHWIIQVWTRT